MSIPTIMSPIAKSYTPQSNFAIQQYYIAIKKSSFIIAHTEYKIPIKKRTMYSKGKTMTFAEKIKALRKERGITQMQLAASTNISLGVIADIESNRRAPSKEAAKRLSEYFCVPVQVFILESEEITNVPRFTKTVPTAQILAIADIVQEYLDKNGMTMTREQRAALIDHFCQQNLTNADAIKQQLSLLGALQSNAFTNR